MAQSQQDLPEGTDSIIEDTPAGAGAYDSFGDAAASTSASGTSASGTSASGTSAFDGETGSTRDAFKQKFADATSGFTAQAGDKARAFASEGKDRATGALDNLAKLVNDAADSVDQQIGPQYGDYARKAAGLVSGLSSQLQQKDVDALVADASDLVRKSPVIAIGAAAALGFVLVRLVKSGIEDAATVGTDPSPATTDEDAPYVAPSTPAGVA